MTLKRILLSIFILFSTSLFASDIPIIFIHGHKSEARPEGSNDEPNNKRLGGWGTWYPREVDGSFDYHTAMTRIVSQNYGGYQYGLTADGSPAKFCDINTNLMSNQGSKRIYNFSYYHPNGNPGVISLSEESIQVYFAQAEEADSLKINSLKKQKLFFAAEDNWIPPSWPNESSCISLGCCLMPLGGCLIGREALKKEARPESLQSIKQPKFSIGISYSPGIAYTGTELAHPSRFSPFPDPGKLPEAIIAHLYLNNRVELGIGYFVNPKWCLETNAAYMWTRLNERNPWFSPKGKSWGESTSRCYWEISTFSGTMGLSYYPVNRKNSGYIEGGLEYNVSEGLSYGEFRRYYSPDTVECLKGTAMRRGKGFGLFLNIGFARTVTRNISFNVSLILRSSLAKEYKWELPSWAVLDGPITYSFSGLYLKIGFSYILLKQQAKKEEK